MSGVTAGAVRVIAVLGSTGSVGRQTLEVAARQGLSVDLLTANRDVATMEAQARAFLPHTVVMADAAAAGAKTHDVILSMDREARSVAARILTEH